MKILHTSDWHVGKVLKGRDRHDEHAAALGSIVRTARDEDVDVVLIAGDLFETAAPNARAQGLVMRTLLALREDGRQVVAIAGNHDNQNLLDAVYRPVLGQLGLHVLGLPKRPGQGGTVALRTRGGETANVAALPFLSHRYAVRAAEVLDFDDAYQLANVGTFSARYAYLATWDIGALFDELAGHRVNLPSIRQEFRRLLLAHQLLVSESPLKSCSRASYPVRQHGLPLITEASWVSLPGVASACG